MRANAVLLIAFLAVFLWSLIRPHDYFTWLLEVFPAIIGFVLVVATRRRFPLTPLLLVLLCLHAIILMVGGHYTYAEVPLGFWMQRAFGWPATTTTASATSRRASSPPSSRGRSSSAAASCAAAAGSSRSWSPSAW